MSESKQTQVHPEGSGPPPLLGPPDIMLWYAAGARATLEAMGTALEFNRNLADIGREIVRRAQDEAIAALLRGLPPYAAPRSQRESIHTDLARAGLEAFVESMAAATRALAPKAGAAERPGTEAGPSAGRSRPAA